MKSAFKCNDFLLFFDIYDNKLDSVGRGRFAWTYEAIWRRHVVLWETVTSILYDCF